MFSRRLLAIFCLILFALTNLVLLSASAKHPHSNGIIGRMVMAAVAPFQEGVTRSVGFCEYIWDHYLYVVSARHECDEVKRTLAGLRLEKSRYVESEQTCQRLHKLLEIKDSLSHNLLAAQVVGVDPSGWFHSIIINVGTRDGAVKGMPVVAPEGIVGQIVKVSFGYSKVMLMIDRSSAIDALVQRTRVRGIIEGKTDEYCRFKYVLRKVEIDSGDVVVSSGFDGIFPKGLRIGFVKDVSKSRAGIFQNVNVEPFVDFTRLEEVLVITNASVTEGHDF